MSISMEEALGIPTQKETITEKEALAKINPIQTQITHTPPIPTRTNILLDLYEERENLKQLRSNINAGKQKVTKNTSILLYLTQQIISADKIMLSAFKETNITVNNTANIDISTQVNELIKFSRERQCNKNKIPTVPS